jgi:hypothetical protein
MDNLWTKALGFLGGWQGYAITAALAVALAVPVVLKVQALGYDATLATERATRAAEKQAQSDAARQDTEVHRALEAALWARIAIIQSESEKEADDAKAEHDKFVADYAAGLVRLWVRARCAAASAGEAAADPATAESCDDIAVELSSASGRTYSSLRDAIKLDQRTIHACQADAAAVRAAYAALLDAYERALKSQR